MKKTNKSNKRRTSNFVDRTTTSIIESTILSNQNNRQFASTRNTIFAIFLLILLIILLSYIVYRGKITNTKLIRLVNNGGSNSDDIRQLFQEMHQTLKSIERFLQLQSTKSNINVILDGKDINELNSNETVLHDFLQKVKEEL
ncbi:hypothetical protein I4U23_013101 [Adineta vaga]|nr:hypothetical protein I4U23_013101 [Adineta vaga]